MKSSRSITVGALFVAGLTAVGIFSGAGRVAASGGATLVPGPCVSLVVQPPPYGVTISTSEFKLNAKLTSCSSDTQTDLVVA